ncbi:MAG: DNA gyrase C-terminal beta-propeller domain-containing protein, partial [Oceanococcaceae bacterium]
RAGYGFVTKVDNLQSRNKAGKALLTVPKAAGVLPLLRVPAAAEGLMLACISTEGRLLVFPLDELPELPRGKGNKLMNLRGDDAVAHWLLLRADQGLQMSAGKRGFTIKPSEMEGFHGSRASRGSLLPRGLQRVDSVTAVGGSEPAEGLEPPAEGPI